MGTGIIVCGLDGASGVSVLHMQPLIEKIHGL